MSDAKYHEFQTPERKADQESCVKESLLAGAKGGLWGFGVSTLVVGLSNHFSPSFRTRLGVSGKTALAVTPDRNWPYVNKSTVVSNDFGLQCCLSFSKEQSRVHLVIGSRKAAKPVLRATLLVLTSALQWNTYVL